MYFKLQSVSPEIFTTMTFGQWLSVQIETRKQSGQKVSGRKVALAAGFTPAHLSRLLNGKVGVSREAVEKIAEALAGEGASIEEISQIKTEAMKAFAGIGGEAQYLPVGDSDRLDYMAFFDNAPNEEAKRRLKIVAEQVAAAWANQEVIIDARESTKK